MNLGPLKADGTKKTLDDALKAISRHTNKRCISKLFNDINFCTER